MKRVQLIGPRDTLPRALSFLQGQGVLDLRAPAAAGGDAALVHRVEPGPEDAGREALLAEGIRRSEALVARLAPGPQGDVLPEALPEAGSAALLERLGAIEEEIGALEARRAALVEERDATERFSHLVVALAPLEHGLDRALSPEYHGLVLKNEPEALALLRGEVRRITGGVCEVTARSIDESTTGVLVVVPRAHGRALSALLFERGVDEVRLPATYAGRALVDVLLLMAARQRAIPGEIDALDAALARRAAALRPALEGAAGRARAELGRLAAWGRCGETRFAYVVSGYVPEERVVALEAAVEKELGGGAALLAHRPERSEWGAVPVVLRNHPWVRPFERLLALVPLPRYGSVDATPWLAVFFPLFFGLVLGDVAFGAIGIAAALLVRWRGWGGRTGKDLAHVALACSVSAVVFGILFGEALGELGAHAGLHPLLLDRRRAFMALLGLALAIGALHVVVGLALGVAAALRRGSRRMALGRAAKLLLVACAAACAGAMAGSLPHAAIRPLLLGAVGCLGLAVLAEGPLAALDLVLGLGNVLSYARLMALGLASVMLAEVANLVAGTLEPRAAGVVLAVLLHAVNFTLGLISPTVAALRLHYVEFFEKFYDEGGAPYRPFALAA
jgi:V/A-type H+-transporting ATPase subunit I